MRSISADLIFTGDTLARGKRILLDETGTVLKVDEATEGAEHFPGLLCPAFVNAHCHLELSYLEGRIPRHTGMAGFVRRLQTIRADFPDEARREAAGKALTAMYERGIDAVGDICNDAVTRTVKADRPEMEFHNFIEVFGMAPGAAETIFGQALDLASELGGRHSITLHAPYSISVRLRDLVLGYAEKRGWPQSIHLLESAEERALFEYLDGPMMQVLREFGAAFQAHTYHSPVDFIFEKYPPNAPALLVHNTEMRQAELDAVLEAHSGAYFALCPLANAFIHDKLPPAGMFAATVPDRVCLGTDSLAGNDRLDIWAEMACLREACGLDLALLLRWATENGARALGLNPDRYRIAEGCRPALLHIAGVREENAKLPPGPAIRRVQP